MFVTVNNQLLQWENLPGASTEVCEQGTPTNQMTNYSFPLGNVETLLLVFHRITTWYLSNFLVSCMHLHFTDFSIRKCTFSCGCISITNTPGQISTDLCDQQQLTKDSEDDSKKFVFQSPNHASSF